jgi:hypothetical protein
MLGFFQFLLISFKSGAFTHSQGISTTKGSKEIMKERRRDKKKRKRACKYNTKKKTEQKRNIFWVGSADGQVYSVSTN